jgi:hypothetical protein
MYRLSSGIFGSAIAACAIGIFAPVAGLDPASAPEPAAIGNSVNRTLKGDRLADARQGALERSISSVEVVGLRAVALIYRDRDGQILFRTDPLSNMTAVARGTALPEVTIRESSRSPVRPLPLDDNHRPAPTGPMPVGCESAFSAIAERSMARIPARCVSSVKDTRKFAALAHDDRGRRPNETGSQ